MKLCCYNQFTWLAIANYECWKEVLDATVDIVKQQIAFVLRN